MGFLEELHAKMDVIATMGDRERAKAREAGVSSYYIDDEFGRYIVEEKPDGSKVLTPFDDPAIASVDAAE